jgi:MacB-like periplasmic core domain
VKASILSSVTQVESKQTKQEDSPQVKSKWNDLQRLQKLSHTLRLLLLFMPICMGGCSFILESPPYKDPYQVVRILKLTPSNYEESVTGIEFLEWRDQSKHLDSIAVYVPDAVTLKHRGDPERIRSGQVSADFFPLLRISPLLGRTFTADEYRPGGNAVMILSYSFWQRRFNGDPNIVGITVDLDQKSYTVVGVTPPEFKLPDHFEIWVPLALDDDSFRLKDSSFGLSVIARLKPDITIEEAQTEMSNIQRNLKERYPEKPIGQIVKVTSLQDAKRLYQKPLRIEVKVPKTP